MSTERDAGITPEDEGRIDGVLFGALQSISRTGGDTRTWDDIADVLCDLRGRGTRTPPETIGFRLRDIREPGDRSARERRPPR